MRSRTRGAFQVPLTIRVPVGGGIHAPELHSDSPEAIYAHTPGLKVVMPSSPYDAKGLLVAAIRDPDPVIFFEPKRIYRAFREEVPEDEYVLPIGKARTVCEGEELTVVSWGASVIQCMQAIEKSGKSVELIDLRTIKPFDIDAVEASVKKTGRCVVVHEAPRTCGFGAEISALIQERCFLHLEAPIARVTGFDTPFPYTLEHTYLMAQHLVVLSDPRHLIVPQNVVPLLSKKVDDKARAQLARVSKALTTDDLIGMNQRFQGDEKASAATIAKDWLAQRGLAS